ncbi:hypothetical protein ACKWTF_014448 [Chironomus riparius]
MLLSPSYKLCSILKIKLLPPQSFYSNQATQFLKSPNKTNSFQASNNNRTTSNNNKIEQPTFSALNFHVEKKESCRKINKKMRKKIVVCDYSLLSFCSGIVSKNDISSDLDYLDVQLDIFFL